jgi:hypothetical protein
MEKKEICRFFIMNKCNHGDKCKFIHDKDICRDYFLGNCKRDKCKFKHTYQDNKQGKNNKHERHNNSKKHVKNTESFTPNYDPPSMSILVGDPNDEYFYNDSYTPNDVIIIPNFIKDKEAYDKLFNEINNSNIDTDKLWKLWHGDSHMIADDNLNWKQKVPTFGSIVHLIEKYFRMDIKSTRFNHYQNSSEWKPFHHDAAAVKEHIAKIQNFTVGVSLGATRDIAFEHAKTKTVISIPLKSGSAYAFSKDVNINWKHGVPQIHPDKAFNEGRISIIAWGQTDVK